MFKRKLFKRALPVILSVAMIFQSTPATALAAENVETEAIVETAEGAEPSDDSSDAGSADSSEPSEVSPASEDAPTADGNSEEQAKEETEGQSTETAKVEESKNDESKIETAQTDESKEEGTSTEASKTEEAPSETVAENQGAETTTTAAEESTEAVVEATSEVEADGETADVNAEQAALDTVIVVKDELKRAFTANGANEDKDAEVLTFKSAYSATENPYSNILSTVEDALSYYLGVEIDGSENTNLPDALKVKWQKKAADKDEWADIVTYPTEVGTYRLLISLDEVADLCKKAEASVNVIIEQAQLTVDVSEIVATPGTTVEAFKTQVAEEYILRNASFWVQDDDGNEVHPEVAKEALVKSITVTVLNAYDKSEVKNANDDGTVNVLATNGDYVMTIAVELLDNVKANYTVESGKVYDFTVADLVETKVIATKIDPGKEITMVYNGQAPDEENLIKKAVNPVKVVLKDDEEKTVSFKEDQITLAWYTKKIDIEDESEVSYEKLAEAPKDAGEYYVKYLYSGEPNVYKESESDAIKVTIEQVPLVLRPEKKDPELKAGMTLDEVRKQLAELKCELFEIKVDEAGKETESPYEAEKGFWGVSYKDKDTTEYYTPVLRLECREAEKDEEGNLVKEDNKIKYGEWKSCEEALSELGELKETSDEIQYRLIFSGKKAVFNADGTTDGKEVDITDTTTMGAEKNYLVRADEKTLEETAVDVIVGTAIATEIDVTEIIKEFNGKTDFAEKDKALGTEENPLWKIYNNEPLFTARDAYKKAVVKTKKAEDADPECKDTAEQLTYEWFVQSDDGEWNSLFDMVVTGADYSVFANQITNVNTYKLQVRYEDPDHNYLSATKDIVFEIRKQEIIVVPESLTARAGKEQDDVTGKFRIYAIPENNEEAFWKLTDEQKLEWVILEQELFAELGNYDSYDVQDKYLKSTVERREMNADGTPKDSYVPMGYNEKFIDGYQYRAYLYYNLEAAGIRNFTNRNKTAMNIAASEAEEETWIAPIYHYNWADVAVKTIGSEKLELMVDETKLPKSHVYGESVAYADVQEAFESGLIQFVLENDHAQVVKPEELFGVDKEGKPDYASGKLNYYFDYEPLDKRLESGYTKTAVDAGTYSLHIYFEGNEKYTDVDDTYEYSFEITQRPLTIKPTLAVTAEDVIPAGEVVDTIYDTETTPFTFDGVAVLTDANGNTLLDDTQGFEYGIYTSRANGDRIIGYPALYTHRNSQTVYNCIFGTNYWVGDDTVSGDDYLRYGKTYQVKFNESLGAVYANNYDVTFLPSDSYEVKARANAQVDELEYGYGNIEYTRLDASITEAGKSQTITPAEGIPFVYNVSGLEGEENPVNGNFFAFAITAPKEFATKFPANGKLIYENSIKVAGGYILGTDTVSDNGYERFRIYVAFNATGLAEDDKTKEFSIRWEDDYVETFTVDFSKAELEADLELAVAPKSLAFNGINSKMVVGEEQALDVKVTKMQLGDIISIGYRTVPEDSDVISIDPKSGVVTALKVSSKPVEIQAYAYKLVNGEEVPFDKPFAKAKISVTDVTAPVIKKIDQIQDNGAQIHFTKVENGYRRELYVLEGKNKSVSEFDTEIQKLENGQETNLVMTPIYDVENEENCIWDAKAKVYKYQIASDNFEIEKDYSVYIRNVSVVRTLENGAVVEKSAKGSIKSFKTTKNQVRDLIPFFDTEKTKVEAVVDENGDLLFYDAWLLDKSVQMSVYGYYKDKDSAASEVDRDLLEFLLPIAKNQPNYYNPKLTYYVFDYNENYEDYEYVDYMKEGWLKQSTYAAVNNKGKVTLKAVDLDGAKMVRLVVASDNNIYGGCTLRITSVPDALKGKNAKMKIGDTINLYEYLNYTENRKKVPNYRSSNLVIENREEAEEAGFIFNDTRNYDEGYSYLSSITATKQVKNFELKLKDTIYYINLETGAHESTELTASIKITVNALDGVKGLKASYIDDKNITLNFTHAGNPSDFLIEVRDARKDLISRKLISNSPQWVYASEEQYEQNKQQHIVDGLTYFQKTKTYVYTISDAKLVRLSSYTITVTPMYGMTEAKAATKKVKTTNIPASYVNMAVRPDDTYGGEEIYISKKNGNAKLLTKNPFLTSGNTYTLIMESNDIPMTRATDTLTWKSSNTKVATVKANPGTYSATLKAVKAGETKIEVTSKITKKVIARYLVCVRPVSSGKSYFGDYEQEWFRQWDPLYTGTVEVLTLSNKVVVNKSSNDYTWVSFTAPAFGEYTFRKNGSTSMWIYDQKDPNGKQEYKYTPMILESGQQIYFRVPGSFTLSAEGSEFAKLSTDAPVNVEAGAWVSYVAPEDNYYTFSVDNGNIASIRLNDENQGSYGAEHSMSLKAGDTVLLKTSAACAVSVARREVVAALDKTGNKANTTLTNDNTESWMTYKASVSGLYTFKVTGMKGVEYTYYKGLESTDEVSPQTVNASPLAKSMSVLANALASVQADGTEVEAPVTETVQIWLNEGETLAIKISLGNVELGETDKCEVSVEVSLPKLPELTTAKPLDVTVPDNSNAAWVFFTIPADGSYSFKAVDKDGNPVEVTYYNDKSEEFESASSEYILVVPDEVVNEYGEKIQINAKDTIYLKVEENATISATEISKSATALTAGKAQAVEISSNGKYWYTFTAPQDGTYVFRMDANIPGPNDSAGLDSVSLDAHLYKAVGKDVIRYFNIIYSTEKVKLSANQTITFCLDAANLEKDSKITGYIYVDSNAAVTPISAKGVDVTIDNAKDKTGTTKWYSFTASSKGQYQFVWKPEEGSGDARIELYDNGVAGNRLYSTTIERNSGAVTYIKVIQTSDTAVKGNLSVTEPASAEKLVSGVAKENIVLTKEQSKYYTFIAPKKAKYVVTTTVSEKDASANLDWNDSSMNTPYAETAVIEAGTVCTLRLTTNNDKATVKLLVQPLEPKAIAKGGNLEAVNGVPSWYAYQIAKTGRYCFAYTPAKDNQISVQYYDSEYNTLSGDLESRYCDAGTTIYVKATSSAEKAQQATFDTEILNAIPLSDSTPIKIAANGKAYYEYKIEKEGIYIFTAKAAENKAVADTMEYFVNMDNDNVETLRTNYAYDKFKKGDKLFIRMKSTAEADFTLTVEQKTIELKANTDSDEITLKSGEKAYFSFNAYEAGNFVFKTSQVTEGADLSVSRSRFTKLDGTVLNDHPWLYPSIGNGQHKGFYRVSRNTEGTNTVISFTVSNDGSEDVKFKVRAERVEPQPIEKTAKLTIAKNEMQWLTFKASEEGRYTVTSSNKEMKLERLDKWGNSLSDLASESIIKEDSTVQEDQRLTMTFAVIYNGEKDTETTDISIAPVDKKQITKTGDTPISLESGASQWIEYTADITADYTFTLKSGETEEDMYLYWSLVNDYSNGYNSVFTASMEPEQKIYFKLTNNTKEKKDYVFTVSAKERKVINLTEGMLSEEVTLKYGEEAHFVFEPSNYGQYIFKTPGLASDARLGISRESNEGNDWDQEYSGYNGFYVVASRPYSGDPKIKFSVRNYATEDITFSVMAEPINPVTVTEGISQIQLEKNEPTWLRFQATKDGRYSFSATVNGTGEEDVISLVQNLDVIGDYNGISSYGLSANGSTRMVVCYYGEESSVSVNISARKEDIQLSSVNNGEPFTVPAYGSKWFSYEAQADMECRFDLNCNNGYGDLYLGVYDSLTSNNDLRDMERSITDGYTTTMTQGQTLYFRVRNYDEEAYECSFILTAKVFEEVLNETLSVETYGDERWTTYTAEEAGNYKIIGYTPDDGDFWVEYYLGENTDKYDSRMNIYSYTNNKSMSFAMDAGESVRVKVYPYNYQPGSDTSYKYSIQIRIVQEKNL